MIGKDQLQNRDGGTGRRDRPPVGDADLNAEFVRKLIAQARALQPSAADDERCKQGFVRGRDAVLALLEGLG